MAGGLLIALGFEFWFFLWEYLDKEISLAKMLFLNIMVFLAFVWNLNVLFGDASKQYALLTIVVAPAVYGTMKGVGKLLDLRISRISRDTEVANLTYTIQQQPDNVSAFVSLGDIYSKEKDYDTAISCYRKATQVMNFPWIGEKIRIAERARRIRNEEIWVCPECGNDNPHDSRICSCGEERSLLKSVRRNISSQREELSRDVKNGLLWIIVGPLMVIIPLVFIIWLIMILPTYLSVVLVLFLLCLGFKVFQRFMDN